MSVRRSVSLLVLALAILVAAFAPRHGYADGPVELVFTVGDTTAPPGFDNGFISIYIDNFYDTIAGFQCVLVSERPDLVRFNFDNGGFDTTGTLVSRFQYVDAIDRAGDQTELWFLCIANLPSPPLYRGFPPQQGGVAVRIPFRTFSIPDSGGSLLCPISVTTPFDFSNPNGYSIGTAIDTAYDTTWFVCQEYVGDSCLAWEGYSEYVPGWDSIAVDTIKTGYLDTTRVITVEGSILIHAIQCDMDGNGSVNVSDLTCLVSVLFGTPSESCTIGFCDLNNSGRMEISDLTALVSMLFGG
jgi:hypothetical protein